MKSKTLAAFAIVAIMALAGVGAGYAAFSGTYQSGDQTLTTDYVKLGSFSIDGTKLPYNTTTSDGTTYTYTLVNPTTMTVSVTLTALTAASAYGISVADIHVYKADGTTPATGFSVSATAVSADSNANVDGTTVTLKTGKTTTDLQVTLTVTQDGSVTDIANLPGKVTFNVVATSS